MDPIDRNAMDRERTITIASERWGEILLELWNDEHSSRGPEWTIHLDTGDDDLYVDIDDATSGWLLARVVEE